MLKRFVQPLTRQLVITISVEWGKVTVLIELPVIVLVFVSGLPTKLFFFKNSLDFNLIHIEYASIFKSSGLVGAT